VFGELDKRPMMWSPLEWDPAAPPAKLVESGAILSLWTGQISQLAYNITLRGKNELVLSNVCQPSFPTFNLTTPFSTRLSSWQVFLANHLAERLSATTGMSHAQSGVLGTLGVVPAGWRLGVQR
jgi:hypothetical protein